jgi:hypothetical protein
MAQTKDGYLWIAKTGDSCALTACASSHGLLRGANVCWPHSLLGPGASDSSPWIGMGYSISHWRSGELINYRKSSGRIEAVAADSDGAVWFVRTQAADGMGPVCRIKPEQLQRYGKAEGIPFPIALRLNITDSGEIWIGGYRELCRWKNRIVVRVRLCKWVRRPETFASLKAVATGEPGPSGLGLSNFGKLGCRGLRVFHTCAGGFRLASIRLEPNLVQHGLDLRVRHKHFPSQAGSVVFHHDGDWCLVQPHVNG